MNIKQLYEEACKKNNYKSIMEEWIDIFSDLLDEIQEDNPKLIKLIKSDLYITLYGEHFNRENAEEAVSGMTNEDGTKGEHWNLTETTRIANEHRIPLDKFNEYDWYYVLNMAYSDYYTIFKDDTSMYVKLALAWLEDMDVPEGKAWRYYNKVVK